MLLLLCPYGGGEMEVAMGSILLKSASRGRWVLLPVSSGMDWLAGSLSAVPRWSGMKGNQASICAIFKLVSAPALALSTGSVHRGSEGEGGPVGVGELQHNRGA